MSKALCDELAETFNEFVEIYTQPGWTDLAKRSVLEKAQDIYSRYRAQKDAEPDLVAGGAGPEMPDGPYEAIDGVVFRKSVEMRNDDGTTSYTLGFPVCRPDKAVGAEQANTIAMLMNAGDAAFRKAQGHE